MTESFETQLYREILTGAHELGGGQNGVKIGCNSAYGFWLASVSIAPPRKKGRWVSAQGNNPTQALHALSIIVADKRREAGLI